MSAVYQPIINEGQPHTREEAFAITALINQQGEALSRNIVEAHDRKAWKALGYECWKDYVEGELKISKQQAFRLLSHERTCKVLKINSTESPIGDSKPPESVTRELTAVPDEKKAEVFAEAVKKSPNGKPTAKEVRAVVDTVVVPVRKQTDRKGFHEVQAELRGAVELSQELEGTRAENEELRGMLDAVTADDSAKQIQMERQKFNSLEGRNRQLQTTVNEYQGLTKRHLAHLDRIAKLLCVASHSDIIPAIKRLQGDV
jgi:hypothetical protein